MTTPHPVYALLRKLRRAKGLSLQQFEEQHGIAAVVVGSWERGDRKPSIDRVDEVLRIYGYELRAVPIGAQVVDPTDPHTALHLMTDEQMSSTLRRIATQIDDHRPASREVILDVLQRAGGHR